MKTKPFFLIVVMLFSVLLTSCIVINAPAASVSPQSTVAGGSAPPTHTSAATSAPTVLPPTTPTPAPTPIAPITVVDKPSVYANPHISVNVHCPEISGMQDTLMQNGINTGVYGFLTGNASALEQQSIQDETNFGPHAAYSYETSFSVMRNDGHLLSILMTISSYEGGAHPSSTFATINAVNSNPGDQWVLSDLFNPGTDYVTQINGEINALIAADAAMNGTLWFSSIDANHAFYLTDTHLVMLFEPYSIAPGAYGAPTFEIPLSHLSGLKEF